MNNTSPTPKTSLLTKLYSADELDGVRTQVVYVQEIPALEDAAEAIIYNALDFDGERQEQGSKSATTITVPVLYQMYQHQQLKAISDSKATKHWFVVYPEVTALVPGKPLVKHFTGSMNLVGDAISIGDMLQDNMTLYRNSEVTELEGLPEIDGE